MSKIFPNSDYYQHVVNKPNITTMSTDFSNILVINSEDRNKYLYPNSNNFVTEIMDDFKDIVEIELISISIGEYTVFRKGKTSTFPYAFLILATVIWGINVFFS